MDRFSMRVPSYDHALRLTVNWSVLFHDDVDPERSRFSTDTEVVSDTVLEFFEKEEVSFSTGSKYTGRWNALGFADCGVYVYPHGVIYKGYFKDGMFHGRGSLIYPSGQEIFGTWVNGKLINSVFKYPDGLVYKEPWAYCKMPDRRFRIEVEEGFKAARDEYKTNIQPTRQIPEGCYDTGTGFYNTKTKCIVQTKEGGTEIDTSVPIEIPSQEHEEHILKYYRNAEDKPTGYQPEFYEFWTTGTQEEIQEIMTENFQEDYGSQSDSL